MNSQLVIHNTLFIIGGILNIILPLLVIYIRRKHLDSLVVTFVLMSFSVAIFQISHVFGTIASTAELSRTIFMFNLSVIPINIFMAHWFLVLTENIERHKKILILIYVTGIVLFIIHLVFPTTYLVESVPKMYFPFYYEPGSLQLVTRVWFNIVGIYYFVILARAYYFEVDPIKKNRYLYVLIAILYAFIVGSSAILLVYDVAFDPMWSGFFGFFPLILAYAVVRYQLLNVRLIVQRAFVYGVSLSVLVAFISFSNALTQFLQKIIPGFPLWFVPLISSTFGVFVGVFFWNKIRESDILKYEFITIIAHKFRTPLTQEKWTLESLIGEENDPDKKNSLATLAESNKKLIDLTGALVELTDTSTGSDSQYSFDNIDMCSLVQSMITEFKHLFESKNILISFICSNSEMYIRLDKKRMQFVLQTLLENASVYTPMGGRVAVSVSRVKTKMHISVADSGIGIAKEDVSRIFSKFYRTRGAKSVDTEGFGIGLFLAQSIVRRHDGKIDISSNGEGAGSTFTIILPVL